VSKAEDIIINRDPRDVHDGMERGEVTPAATILEKDASLTQTPTSDGEESGQTVSEREGSVILSEWREGPHQVIERKSGPGEEVSLLVLNNSASWYIDGIPPNLRSKSKSVETCMPQKTWSA
jgi:hypothetical protein